jgi:group II intron reverse transcriptase/maturase
LLQTVAGKTNKELFKTFAMDLMRQVLNPRNLATAQHRVVSNGGSPGIDGMKVTQLKEYMQQHREDLIEAILSGTYQPQPVRGVEIPKASGGKRLLGIPTAIDRLIQQAIHQVLSPLYEIEFSGFSYGFRPNKGAHQAVSQSLAFINSGYQDIIDLDLKSFFDVVNHDYLMSILYRKVKDKPLLKLIRKYLKSGIMLGGATQLRHEGTPQGSPLSPLLSNILLNELDSELTKRNLRFVRYADDCSIFLSSKRAANRVLASITRFIEQDLKLKVNHQKTSICRPVNFHTLGYNFVSTYRSGEKGTYRLRVSPKRFAQMKRKVKEITRKTRPVSFSERIAELYPVGIIFLRGEQLYERLDWVFSLCSYAFEIARAGYLDSKTSSLLHLETLEEA